MDDEVWVTETLGDKAYVMWRWRSKIVACFGP